MGSSEVRLGDNLQITLNLNTLPTSPRDITYLVSKVERASSTRHGLPLSMLMPLLVYVMKLVWWRSSDVWACLCIQIQSRGQLVNYGRLRTDLTSTAITLQVTKEMLPSFRIMAYHHDGDEVVSDSVWVDVIDTCMGSVRRSWHQFSCVWICKSIN